MKLTPTTCKWEISFREEMVPKVVGSLPVADMDPGVVGTVPVTDKGIKITGMVPIMDNPGNT